MISQFQEELKINRDELIRMMSEYWAIDNNDTCAIATLIFMRKYGISTQEVDVTLEDGIATDYTLDELEHVAGEEK